MMTWQPHAPGSKHRIALAYPSASIEAYEGAVASSKTVGTLIDWVDRCVINGPDGLIALVGKTERAAINNLILPLQQALGPDLVQIKYGSGTVTICGRVVNIYGAANEQAITKIQGLTLAGAYVDEATNIPESFFNMLYSRLRVPGALMWLTCNPDHPRHWLKTKWLDRARLHVDLDGQVHDYRDQPGRLELHRYTFNIDDNPFLPAEYVKRMKTSYAGVFYKRMILSQWVAAEGAIYDAFDAEKHVVPGVPADAHGIADGVDAGTTNPSRGYALKLAPAPAPTGIDGMALYVTREWAPPTGRTDGWYSADYKAHRLADTTPGRFVYVDPAAKSLRVQMAQDGVRTVAPASNDVLAGIRTVASLIAAGRLYITADCAELLKEIVGYVWDPKATAAGIDKPLKIDDHAMDAMRYAVYSSRHLWQAHIPVNAAEPVPDDDVAA